VWPKPVPWTCWKLRDASAIFPIFGLQARGEWPTKDMASCSVLCGATVDSRNLTSRPIPSQALRVVVVVHLFLASPGLCTLGRALVVLATTLSIVSLSSIVRLSGAGILQTLRVVVVQFFANEGLLAFGSSSVVVAAALPVQSLGGTVCRNFAIRLRWCFAGCSSGLICDHAGCCCGEEEGGD